MNKILLLTSAILLSAAMTSNAENKLWVYPDGNGYLYGHMRHVSPNGEWAVCVDDAFETGSIIVKPSDPLECNFITTGELYDVANNGTAVGAWYENIGTDESPVFHRHAAVWKNDEWKRLEEPAVLLGESHAIAITPDAKHIGGVMFCRRDGATAGGKYFPAVWTYNETTSEYDLTLYNDLDMPNHYGFFPMNMSDDGRMLVGQMYTGYGNTVCAIVEDGKLRLFNKVEERFETVKETIEGKEHTWQYERGYVDGVLEEAHDGFYASFYNINGNYVYGNRMVAKNVNEAKGEGEFEMFATIYNIETDEFIDDPQVSIYSCGKGTDVVFAVDAGETCAACYYVNNGVLEALVNQFGLEVPEGIDELATVYSIDDEGKIITGSALWLNEVVGGYCETPFIITLDTPLTSEIREMLQDLQKNNGIVYDLNGRRVNSANPAPGIYIRDGKKFVVK